MIIGYAYVVGDILHEGHLLHLRNCKGLCDKLIVGVLTDEAVMQEKPKPSLSFERRIALVAALECVDAAVPQYQYSPVINLSDISPDIHFECSQHDYMGPYPADRVISMPYYPGISSTQIKENIRDAR
ncbi:unnamed protein product [marine sediment metagenome]|uniref:Cytidyltransferase-like domain-containing protein n=1 Tax=marine sediment metagenome TaxID=412755 RepID=X0TQ83_9ZZZZ